MSTVISPAAAQYTISVDTGGTFTDMVVSDAQGVVGLFKASTTPHDLFEGISDALEIAAAHVDLSLEGLLEQTRAFVYSTTRSTNAILEGKVARTAFITTRGNRDILLYREGGKDDSQNLSVPFKTPYVPRRLCFELTERVLHDGSVAVGLDEAEVCATLERLRELEVEAIGVCLLWSIVNADHEVRVGELIEEILPDVPYSLSHRVNRIPREYRRASSTVIDASIKPLMRSHLMSLEGQLRARGFAGEPLMVTHVSGGVLHLDQMLDLPVQTVDSGPALAPVAGLVYAGLEPLAVAPDVLTVDTGGTSFDVSLGHDGRVVYTREKWLGPLWYGHMTGLPAVDTRSLGAGGGSIASVDVGGLLRVGPESAGADPGPACYGRGGTLPTVTDAALILGYLSADRFLGGRMRLDVDAAREAIRMHVAERLRLSVEQAAEAVLDVTSESMRGFIVDMTVSQGRDPRDCVVVAGGGAAGINIVRIAKALDVRDVIIPRLAGGLSATGGQFTDISSTFSVGKYAHTARFDYDGVSAALNELRRQMVGFLEGVDQPGQRSLRFVCEARYDKQIWEIDVDLGPDVSFRDEADVEALKRQFDAAHRRIFAVDQPGCDVEIVTWRGEARVERDKPDLGAGARSRRDAHNDTLREAWFGGSTYDTVVLTAPDRLVGQSILGPAIIEEPTTTIVLDPGCVAIVRPTHYLIQTSPEAVHD